jgi:hypothetical protein
LAGPDGVSYIGSRLYFKKSFLIQQYRLLFAIQKFICSIFHVFSKKISPDPDLPFFFQKFDRKTQFNILISDAVEILREMHYPRLISLENFRLPNFPLMAEILEWMVRKYAINICFLNI